MAKGTIKRVLGDKGYGFIQPEERGDDIWFHATKVKGDVPFAGLNVGLPVEYETEPGRSGGFQAKFVRALAAPSRTRSPSRPAANYRFLNPYNFVRPLSPPMEGAEEKPTAFAAALQGAGLGLRPQEHKPELQLLGRCSPPPHDRYVGITGEIICTLRAETPLFISNSEGIEMSGEHKSYEFFKLDGSHAIPASSLRGSLRSVFEAVTNSCMSTLNDVRLSYHLPPADALMLVPARAEQDDKSTWSVRLLPGTTPLGAGRRPNGPQYAAWVRLYQPLRASQNMRGDSAYGRRTHVNLEGYSHKARCQALIKLVRHPRRNFEFWNVERLGEGSQGLTPRTSDERVAEGYLCITNQNIENKHDERFFFDGAGLQNARRIPLPKQAIDDYSVLIRDYQQRHRDKVNERRKRGNAEQPEGKSPAFSRFILNKNSSGLEDGDLVYVSLKDSTEVDFIVPVSVPRVAYKQSIAGLLPDKVLPDEWQYISACRHSEFLCPACRVFGWVHEAGPKDAMRVAYAGRVRISHGKLVNKDNALRLGPVPLAILSSPKPTTTRFYLMPKATNSMPEKWGEGADDGYTYGNTVRGRKFYRHHGKAKEDEYGRAGGRCDDQNRTVRDALAPGAEFEFIVQFENLASLELGALLWTLEMDTQGFHRLGFAKSLGFGSVTIRVNSLRAIDPARRYASIESDGSRLITDKQKEWVDDFKTAMANRYGYTDFESLPNVKDMRALLGNPPNGLPVHYPRTGRRPDPEGKNFEWFMGNNRYQKYALPSATEDNGLPLIARDGTEVK